MGEAHRMDVTATEAAKAVRRMAIGKDGNEVEVAVKASEVLACAVRDDSLTVVTTSGEKLIGAAPKPAK